jgi:hypothetical protein
VLGAAPDVAAEAFYFFSGSRGDFELFDHEGVAKKVANIYRGRQVINGHEKVTTHSRDRH